MNAGANVRALVRDESKGKMTVTGQPDADSVSHAVVEHRFTCPYCWEPITMLLDLTVADQSYVEDCEVCCNPISLHVRAEHGAVVAFDARQLP